MMAFQTDGGALIFAAVFIFAFVFGLFLWGVKMMVNDLQKRLDESEANYRDLYNKVHFNIERRKPHPPFPDHARTINDNGKGQVKHPPHAPRQDDHAIAFLPPVSINEPFAPVYMLIDDESIKMAQEKGKRELEKIKAFEKGNRQPISDVLAEIYDEQKETPEN